MNALHAIGVMTAAVLKFFFSPIASYRFGNGFWETVLLVGLGGCIGALAFYLGSAPVLEWFRLRRLRNRARALARGQRPKRIFTRSNRLIVRMKRGYGMQGLVFLLPPLLSIPITAVLAAKYFRTDRRTLPFLLIAVVAWSVVLSAAWKFTR
ncbi:MAG: hypothetical protein JST38_13545 [Bacteroidetes bacterium]|nr:hypothetical protein [Bacteroidota bacterium]MBS1941892.1 hypothetical protein [Bacteroidota bacterium]